MRLEKKGFSTLSLRTAYSNEDRDAEAEFLLKLIDPKFMRLPLA